MKTMMMMMMNISGEEVGDLHCITEEKKMLKKAQSLKRLVAVKHQSSQSLMSAKEDSAK